MKRCDHYKDLILMDEMNGSLEGHLLDCADCRAFFKEVKNNAILPFQKAARQPVPAALWDNIKQRIEQPAQVINAWDGIIEKIKGFMALPKILPAFASLVIMLAVGSVTVNTIQVQQAQEKDQGEYLASLLSPASTAASFENNDLGTPIEHYFL